MSRGSAQKQEEEVAAILGGVQAPWTSKSLPHLEAQAGRTEEKGTMRPSATACAEMRGMMLESRRIIWVCILRFECGLFRGEGLSRRRRSNDRDIDQLLLYSCRVRARRSWLLKQFIQRSVLSTLSSKQLSLLLVSRRFARSKVVSIGFSCLFVVRSSYIQGCSLLNIQSRLSPISRDFPLPFSPCRGNVSRARVPSRR